MSGAGVGMFLVKSSASKKPGSLHRIHGSAGLFSGALVCFSFLGGCRSPDNRNDSGTQKTDCAVTATKNESSNLASSTNKKGLGLVMPESAPVSSGGNVLASGVSAGESSTAISLDDVTQATVGLQIKLTTIDNEIIRSICTGVLIGKNTLVTAAHCLAPPSVRPMAELSGYIILATGFDTARGPEIFEIDKTAVHPDWNGVYNDIAVVFSKKPFPDDRKAVSVEPKSTEVVPGNPVVLVGYGTTGDGKSDGGVSRRGESFVHSMINRINYPESILQNQVRIKGTPDTSAGACTGDSGGPSFVKSSLRLLGIVSGMNLSIQGSMECKNRDANYTIVESYMPWLELVTGQKPSMVNSFVSMKELQPAVISADAISAVGFVVKPPAKDSMQKNDNSGLKSEDSTANKGGC